MQKEFRLRNSSDWIEKANFEFLTIFLEDAAKENLIDWH